METLNLYNVVSVRGLVLASLSLMGLWVFIPISAVNQSVSKFLVHRTGRQQRTSAMGLDLQDAVMRTDCSDVG